jgi:hypothetical protein
MWTDQHHDDHDARAVTVWPTVQGAGHLDELVAPLADLDGVLTVSGDDANALSI